MKKLESHHPRFIRLLLTAALALAITAGGAAAAVKDDAASMLPNNLTTLAAEVRDGVVNIRTVKTIKGGGPVFRHFFGNPFDRGNPFEDFMGPHGQRNPSQDFKQRSLGSGFIIDREGHIVTNNHVIDGADEITVKLADGKEFTAELVGRDPNTDLALIKIAPSGDLKPLQMGKSGDLAVGTWVVAIGSPFGLEQTVTVGIVSAKGRIIGSGPYDDFIQTDASINPGNSGGPLLNLRGEVVGINTAIVARGQGIGFAIPSDLAQNVLTQLQSKGEVTRGWLGVAIQDLSPDLADYYKVKNGEGVLVSEVYAGDPADKAGIQAQDIIVAIDGRKVTASRELSAMVANSPVGSRLSVDIMRSGKPKTVAVTLAKREQDVESKTIDNPQASAEFGLQVSDLDRETAQRLGLDPAEKGVVVIAVSPESKAEAAGLRQGDLIKEVNRSPVENTDALRKMLKKSATEPVQFLVLRPGAGLMVLKITP
ncbi:MAG: Do family serine endopeptidase [Desulfobacterales bacterium]